VHKTLQSIEYVRKTDGNWFAKKIEGTDWQSTLPKHMPLELGV
jgi:hypothetical protein